MGTSYKRKPHLAELITVFVEQVQNGMVQFPLDSAVIFLFALGNDIKGIDTPDLHHTFIIRTADDLRNGFSDFGKFLFSMASISLSG